MTMPTAGSAVGASISSGAVTCTFGAGTHATGDLLIAMIASSNDVTSTFSAPSGWTAVPNSPTALSGSGSTGVKVSCFYQLAPDANSIGCGTFDGGALNFAFGIVVSNFDSSGAIFDTTVASTGTANTSMSLVGPTTTVDDCLIIYAYASKYDPAAGGVAFSAQSNGNLANLTEKGDNAQPTGTGLSVGFTVGELATAGDTGTMTMTQPTSSLYAYMVIPVMGVVSGGGGPVNNGRITLLGAGK